MHSKCPDPECFGPDHLNILHHCTYSNCKAILNCEEILSDIGFVF